MFMPSPIFEPTDEHPRLPGEGGGRHNGPTLPLSFEVTSAFSPLVQRDMNPSHTLTSAFASTDFN